MPSKEDIFAACSSAVCLGVMACATVAYGETNYAFQARLLEVHPARQAAAAPAAAPDETHVGSAWRVVALSDDPVLVHAAHDLRDYLGKWRMGNVKCRMTDGNCRIEVGVDPALKELQSKN